MGEVTRSIYDYAPHGLQDLGGSACNQTCTRTHPNVSLSRSHPLSKHLPLTVYCTF